MTSNNDPAYSKILHASWHVKEWEGLERIQATWKSLGRQNGEISDIIPSKLIYILQENLYVRQQNIFKILREFLEY